MEAWLVSKLTFSVIVYIYAFFKETSVFSPIFESKRSTSPIGHLWLLPQLLHISWYPFPYPLPRPLRTLPGHCSGTDSKKALSTLSHLWPVSGVWKNLCILAHNKYGSTTLFLVIKQTVITLHLYLTQICYIPDYRVSDSWDSIHALWNVRWHH
jgi:hypothetical protein